jgi:SPP1 family predicted phage head-tail adaptor
MAIGSMRERVTIQSKTRTADGAGGAAVAWVDLATVWARVTPKAASEPLNGDQKTPHTIYTIRIRYRADTTAIRRIVWRSRTFNIIGTPNPDERRRYLDIEAEEGAAT